MQKPSQKRGWALQAAEKLLLARLFGQALYQGMTSVMPKPSLKRGWALQAAEKLPFGQAFWPGFVSGHDFSRADKANKMNRALAPAGPVFVPHDKELEFFRSLFGPCRSVRETDGLDSYSPIFENLDMVPPTTFWGADLAPSSLAFAIRSQEIE